MTDEQTPPVVGAFAGGAATRESLAELTEAVDRLTDEATDIRSQLRSRTRALWTAVTVGGILLAVVLAAAVVVTLNNSRAIEANNRRFCPLVGILVPSPGQAPASTPRGVQVEKDARRFGTTIGCRFP